MTTRENGAAPASPSRGNALVPLLYWLVLVYGLALLTSLRIDEVDKTVPLWVGSVLGTALGQLLGRLRVRLWLVFFVVVNLLWILPLAGLPIMVGLSVSGSAMEILLMAFVPAALSGYFALSERGGLLAFWFPAAVWMISILDEADHGVRDGWASWMLLGALALGLLAFMLAREARRVALWQGDGVRRLAEVRSPVVLREEPLRRVSRAGWIAALAAGTLALTAWIAPHLWQKEKIEHKSTLAPQGEASGGWAGAAQAEVCCPEDTAEAPRSRVSEYLPFVRPHDEPAYMSPAYCAACRDGVPIRGGSASGPTETSSESTGASGSTGASVPAAPQGPAAPSPPHASPAPGPAAPAPIAATPQVTAKPPPAAPPPMPRPALPPPAPPPKARVPAGPPVVVAVTTVEISPLEWLLTLAIVGMALSLTLRALRRLLVLRHLGRPLWAETVDQRVSNLWQLMLIGLRDAGWVPAPGEQPGELARRVGLAGMEACAAVLDRARHGVRVDAGDLAAMERAAAEAYRAARGRIGWAARMVSWLRWPLV